MSYLPFLKREVHYAPLGEGEGEDGMVASLETGRQGSKRRLIGAFMAGLVLAFTIVSIVLFSSPFHLIRDDPSSSSSTSTSPSPSTLNATNLVPAEYAAPVRLHFLGEDSINGLPPLHSPSSCPITVLYSSDAATSDVIIYNSDKSNLDEMKDWGELRRERPWQKQVVWGSESARQRPQLQKHYELVEEGRREETFDMEMTYRLDSAVPGVYSYSFMDFTHERLPYDSKRQNKIAAAFISNCGPLNARAEILKALISLLPAEIDSFGACEPNSNVEEVLKEIGRWDVAKDDQGRRSRWNLKMTTLASYKFTIAMENSNERDYVTEKLYQPFEFGSVPIYFGTRSISSFLPSPNSIMNVNNYLPPVYSDDISTPPHDLTDEAWEGLRRLASDLKRLSSEEGREEYEKMLEWKSVAGREEWRETGLGRVQALAKERWSDHCRIAGMARDHEWAKSSWKEEYRMPE